MTATAYPIVEADKIPVPLLLKELETAIALSDAIHKCMVKFERGMAAHGQQVSRPLLYAAQQHYFSIHNLRAEVAAVSQGTTPRITSVDPNNIGHHEVTRERAEDSTRR